MKLLKQTSLNFISASVFFFLIAIIIIYISVRIMANYYLEAELLRKKDHVEYNYASNNEPKEHYNTFVVPVKDVDTNLVNEVLFSDTIVYNDLTKSYQLTKKIKFFLKKEQQYYKVYILQSQSFIDIYVMVFSLSLLILVGLLFIILFIVNRHSIKVTLRVFYNTINQLKNFDINKTLNLEQDVEVDEFKQLNKTINLMSERIKQDFINLKQYSENTSHEIQTPLAIIIAKLEELLQAENLTEKQLTDIYSIINTADRLSNINKALIFLTKIDNRIYADIDKFSLNYIIKTHVETYNSLIEDKSIKVELQLQSAVQIIANKILIETLINNLIANAITHNINNGTLKIILNNNTLIIENTGKAPNIPEEQLFNRFQKGNPGDKSLGIGLSIVKKICDVCNYKIAYNYNNQLHTITILLK